MDIQCREFLVSDIVHSSSPQEFVDIDTDTKRTKLSKGWYYQECREGRLRHFRAGRRILLRTSDVDLRMRVVEPREAGE